MKNKSRSHKPVHYTLGNDEGKPYLCVWGFYLYLTLAYRELIALKFGVIFLSFYKRKNYLFFYILT